MFDGEQGDKRVLHLEGFTFLQSRSQALVRGNFRAGLLQEILHGRFGPDLVEIGLVQFRARPVEIRQMHKRESVFWEERGDCGARSVAGPVEAHPDGARRDHRHDDEQLKSFHRRTL